MGHDRGVALADARGLDDHQVKTGDLAGRDHIRQRLRDLGTGFARGQRAHEDTGLAVPRIDRVHADAVAQQRAARFATRRIDRDDRDVQRVVLIEPDAADQLVGQRRLAGAAGAGDAQRRRLDVLRRLMQRGLQRGRYLVVFQRGDQLRQRPLLAGDIALLQGFEFFRRVGRQIHVAHLDHRQDHADQTHALAVFRAENAGHAVRVQVGNLVRHDHAAAAAEHLDMRAAALFQQIDHVLEILDVAALITRNRNALHIFLQGGGDDFIDRTVVTEVDHLGAVGLQDAAHDVDRRIVAVEQRGGGDETDLVGGLVLGQFFENREVGHGASLSGQGVRKSWGGNGLR